MSSDKTTNDRRRLMRYEFQIDNRRSGMSAPEWMPVIGRDHVATLEDCEAMAKRATEGNWPPHRIVPHESGMTDITKPPIHVWPFHDAPQAYRNMSPHGGDEDWIALIPPYLANQDIAWMWHGTPFGSCDVSEHPQPDGSLIRIGAHS